MKDSNKNIFSFIAIKIFVIYHSGIIGMVLLNHYNQMYILNDKYNQSADSSYN